MTEKKVDELSFEEAMGELENIVRALEGGNVRLDDALKAYSRGMELKTLAEKKLSDAKLKIERLSVGANKELSVAEFTISE